MGAATWWAAGGLGALLAAPVAAHGVAHVRAAAQRRRARRACPNDGGHEPMSLARTMQLLVAESVLWWYTVATAVRPPAETAPGSAARIPVMVLPPPFLPRASVRMLVARLRRDGFSVVCPRPGALARSRAVRVRALDRALRASWDRDGARAVDLIAPAGAAALAAAHLASGGGGVPVIRRLLTIGAAAAEPTIPPGTEVIAFYSPDDPLLGPVEAGPHPGAVVVAIRGFGRLGLLHAPYVYALIREHLLAPSARPSSWTSAAS